MEILSYIFHLGILFIIFEVLWNLFLFLVKMAFPANQKSPVGTMVIRAISFYFLVVLAADESLRVLETHATTGWTIMIAGLGAAILYTYLAGKAQRGNFRVTINAQQLNVEESKLTPYLLGLAVASTLTFVLLIFFPDALRNGVTDWIGETILAIYNTPVIGWIFGFAGLIFAIITVFRGIAITQALFSKVGSLFGPKPPPPEEERFDDYEVIEDDKLD